MLEEGMGFGTSFVCYAGTTKPLVADGLRAAARLGQQRLIVLPFLLFDGILVKRIYDAASGLAARHPEIEVLTTHYMGVHSDIADLFLERAHEGVEGRAHMNCSLCKYRVQIVGFERQVGEPQRPHHRPVTSVPVERPGQSYVVPPLEAANFRVIEAAHDWSRFSDAEKHVVQRLVQTSGDMTMVDDLFVSPGAVEAGIRALLRCRRVVADDPLVENGIQPGLLQDLAVATWCGTQERETAMLAPAAGLTPAAAGLRLAYERFGNDLVLALGTDPAAVDEALRLIQAERWRPQLVIGLPAGFVGAVECKAKLRTCIQVPRLTNSGPKGGALWAAAVLNALLIEALNRLAAVA
jgi:precorrin-8X/cobalt-precorrin-8 methylmutase